MSTCAVCEHANRDAIDAALDRHRHPNVIGMQFRVTRAALQAHIAHRRASPMVRPVGGIVGQGHTPALADDPLQQFTRHVHEAVRIWYAEVPPEQRTPERLHMILEEAFSDPEMGL